MISILSAGCNDSQELCREGNKMMPAPIPLDARTISSVSTGSFHTVIIYQDGSVFGWGSNRFGELGLPVRQCYSAPTKIEIYTNFFSKVKIITAVCGNFFTLFLSDTGDVYISCENTKKYQKIISINEQCTKISGYYDPYAIGVSGKGYKISMNDFNVVIFDFKIDIIFGIKDSALLVLNNDSVLKCDHTKEDNKNLEQISSLSDQKIVKIVGNNDHFVALSKDGKVFVWGSGKYGKLGLGNDLNVFGNDFIEVKFVSDLNDPTIDSDVFISDIGAGYFHTNFVDSAGNIWSTGGENGDFGQIMNGDKKISKFPVKSERLKGVVNVYCGSRFTLVKIDQNKHTNQKQIQLFNEEKIKYIKEIKRLHEIIEQKNIEIQQLKDAHNQKIQNESHPCAVLGEEDFKKLKKVELIGRGATSEVYRVEHPKSYALKILNTTCFVDLKNFIKEFELLSMVVHPCIIKIKGFCYGNTGDQQSPSILLSYESSTLSKVITDLSNTDKVRIIIEILMGMKFIQNFGIIHRDLKPENILLTNKNKHVRITDFGLATLESLQTSMTKGVGTLQYMAPEVLNNEKYTYKVDQYSFGKLFYFIVMNGNLPEFIIRDVVTGKEINVPEQLPDFVKDIIHKCCSMKPDERPTFESIITTIKEHDYKIFQRVDKSAIENRINQILAQEGK